MIVPFIPYFVAANLVTNTSPWSKGPEYVFSTKLEFSMHSNQLDDILNNTSLFNTRCQPGNNDTLNCYMTLVSHYTSNPMGHRMEEHNETSYFELKFNATGVANIAVPENTRPPQQLVLRRIASLFSVGVDLSDPAITSTEGTTELSLLGECADSLIKVKTQGASGNAEHLDGKAYDLYPIPFDSNGRRMNIVIDKARDPKKCSSASENYFFVMPPNRVEIKSSASRITVSDSGDFDSWTDTESKFEMVAGDESKEAILREHLQISLSSVKEATEPIPPLSDPLIFYVAVLPEDIEVAYDER